MSELTPMLKQYQEIKKNTKDALVFYRLGDFYELFYEDALIASKVLDLVLTARAAGNEQKAPMCGVPHHAAGAYIQKLIQQGYKVAIAEQVEDPKDVKGIVKREVTEILTPGTYFEQEENESRYIASIQQDLVYASLVFCDVMSGELKALRVMNQAHEIIKALQQFNVKELVVSAALDENLIQEIKTKSDILVSYENDLDKSIRHEDPFIREALARLVYYLEYTQKRKLSHLQELLVLNDEAYLRMDYNTLRNLELFSYNNRQSSLYDFINETQTAMGARALRKRMMQPYVDLKAITKQQAKIDVLREQLILLDELKSNLSMSYDLERILARLGSDKHNAQDLVRLKISLQRFAVLQDLLRDIDVFHDFSLLDPLQDLAQELDEAIYDDAPVAIKEGRTFKSGINGELDRLIDVQKNGRKWLLDYENQQKDKTGIRTLKVGYNRTFGYYIEISKGQIQNVKDDFAYIRKQTLINAERYTSKELQDFALLSQEASERVLDLEQKLFEEYSAKVKKQSSKIHQIAMMIADLDLSYSLSRLSLRNAYHKPQFNQAGRLALVAGRHPVLEDKLTDHQYIASDLLMDEKQKILLLTGPNMGGKSTYMRMLAQNIVLAQMGSYVACESLDMQLFDQIFTRMGASDDILIGNSTFMVEMLEAQDALSSAGKDSLILFDELGRGTSTYDGMALAQAIIEYILYNIGAKTVFSTHYHELVDLETMHAGIENIHVEVHEENDNVTFLYKVLPGRADKSYGINVARLARLPHSVIKRAQENLELFEASHKRIDVDAKLVKVTVASKTYERIQDKLKDLDMDRLKPIEALLVLSELKELVLSDED